VRDPDRLKRVFADIDVANSADPARQTIGSETLAEAVVYGRRMSAILERLAPEAGEELRIAVRGQHIERFAIPRSNYPFGKAGYYRWRKAQMARHAERLAQIMASHGYPESSIARVGQIVRKERLAEDGEAQTLEDAAALVFLVHEFERFVARGDYPDDKIADILAKTWAKMSERGRAAAQSLDVPPRALALLKRGLASG
jgi:hypothetical protein